MAFFANDAVNRVNAHSTIQALAQSSGGIFLLAFLVQSGVGVPAALLAMSAILALRFVLRPLVLPLAMRFGVKPLLISGSLVLAVQLPLLTQVSEVGGMLVVFCAVSAVGDVLYWPSYHTWFAVVGDAQHRGHQVSAREALVAFVGVGGPLLGAGALLLFGPLLAFSAVGVVQAMSVLPLLGAPNVAIRATARDAYAAARMVAQIDGALGWYEAWNTVWFLALFLLLDQSYGAFGGAMALAALAGAAFGMVLGKPVASGGGERTVTIAVGAASGLLLLRAASGAMPVAAVATTTISAFGAPLLATAAGPAFYNQAQSSACPLRFYLVTEAAWDLGSGGAFALAAGLIALGVPMAWTIMLALPALAIAAWLLRGYYRRLETQRLVPLG